jgi:hypothetical protein
MRDTTRGHPNRDAITTINRLMRRLHRHGCGVEGYSINTPNVGDYLVHVRAGDGPRKNIRVLGNGDIIGFTKEN